MEKIDARKHSPETKFEIRKQVVRLRGHGFLNKDVAKGVSVSGGRASIIWQSYKKKGSKTIKLGRRDRREGENRTLRMKQEVRKWLEGDTINPELLINFMTRLTRDAGRKVFLILFNLHIHHSKNAKKWLKEHKGEIEVFYLSL